MLVKISEDGAKFSRSSSFVLLSFSLPGTAENVLSSSGKRSNTWTICTMYMYVFDYMYMYQLFFLHVGNHTFAAIHGSESYHLSSLSPVVDEINSLIRSSTVDGYDVDILVGGDYKVHYIPYNIHDIVHVWHTCTSY